MKVHILILNYNGADILRRNLASFTEALKVSRYSCRLSVIDNCSIDESRDIVSALGGVVGWMPMKENRVLCSYNDAARTLDDDILIFMNNDIKVDPSFIDPLVEPFEKNLDIFFVTPKCLAKDGQTYEGNKTRAWIRFGVYWSSSTYPGYEKDVEALGPTIQGGFGAFDRKKFLELDGYDDLYLPGRLEDADVCFRAYKRGWRSLYQPKSVVYHEGGVSFHKAFGIKRTLVINWRNTFLFMWKNLSDGLILLKFILWLPVRLVYSLVFFKPEICMGFFEALPLLGKALERRRALKASGWLNSVPDRKILSQV